MIAIWNEEAQSTLFDRWHAALTNAIPEAISKPC